MQMKPIINDVPKISSIDSISVSLARVCGALGYLMNRNKL